METTLLTAYAVTLAPHPSTRGWAIAWLSGTDRSADAATRAAASAEVFVHASGCAGMDKLQWGRGFGSPDRARWETLTITARSMLLCERVLFGLS